MSNLNSWEDDPAAQDDNLAQQASQMNLNQQSQQGNFRPGAASFQPTAQSFQPGQAYSGQSFYPQYGQQGGFPQYSQYGGAGGYSQYGQGGYPQYQQSGYGNQYNQGGSYSGYNQGYNNQQGFQSTYQNNRGGRGGRGGKGGGQNRSDNRQQSGPSSQASTTPTATASSSTVAPPASKPIAKTESGSKVSNFGVDNKPPKATKVLSIGTSAAPKEEPKREEASKKDESLEEKKAESGTKTAAAKAIEKTGTKISKSAGSGKTSPSPSSGRSSPSGSTKGGGNARDVDAVEKEQAADVDEDTLKEIYGKEHVNVIFIGHVDAGKSTLGGAILYSTGMVDERTMDKYKKEAKEMGRETWYLSWALDLTKEERSKGKTVEVGRAYFETEKRRYSILDAPGHKTYVPNMIGGASQADVGVLVISARKGEYETGFEKGGQTREHAMLAKTQGVNKLIVVVNKMDDPTVNWSKERYTECTTKLAAFLKGTGYSKNDVFFMPIAAQQSMGIKDRVPKDACTWWEGPSLLEYLDGMQALERKLNAPFMMAIAGKYKDMGTMVEGKIEAGVTKKGMTLTMMPNKSSAEVTAVYGETEEEMAVGQCGDQVKLRLRGIEEEDILPGFVLCSPKRLVHCVSQFEAQIRILDLKSILTAGFNCVLHVHAAIEEVTFAALLHKLQKGTGRKSKHPPSHAKKGDSIIARMQVIGGAGAVCIERFEDYAQMGRFTLRDQGQTIAIGKIIKLCTDDA